MWQGSAVALATLCALRLLRRSSGQARYAFCAICLLGVLALPLVSVAGSRPPHAANVIAALPPGSPLLAVPGVWWTSGAFAIGIWFVWCAAHAAWIASAMLALQHARRASLPLPPGVESRLPFWNAVKRSRRRSRLVVSDDVASVAVLGGGSPLIA